MIVDRIRCFTKDSNHFEDEVVDFMKKRHLTMSDIINIETVGNFVRMWYVQTEKE